MAEIAEMISRMNKRATKDILNFETDIKESINSFKIFTDEIRKELLKCNNHYDKPIHPNTSYKSGRSSKRLVETSSSDEENEVSSTKIQLHESTEIAANLEGSSLKPKRSAAKAASANIKKFTSMKLNSKMRRPSIGDNAVSSNVFELNPVSVKTEKLSDASVPLEPLEEAAKTALLDVTNAKMPPPTAKPKRGRKKVKKEAEESTCCTRSTRTRSKIAAEERIPVVPLLNRKDSDVEIQEVPVTVVVVTDSGSEADKSQKLETEKIEPKKSKRGRKPKKQQTVPKIKVEKEDQPVQNNTQNSVQEESVYEDAISQNNSIKNPGLNETHIINKPFTSNKIEVHSPAINEKIKETGVQLNCTVVLETMHSKPENLNETKILSNKPVQTPPPEKDLITDDDESFEAPLQPPTQTPNKKPVKSKPIFSPYGNSPVKKRVAAFEKLGTVDVPPRVTRTKTRNQETQNTETPLNKKPIPTIPAPSSKLKKTYTPTANNKLPSMIPQSENKYKSSKNTSVASTESLKSLTVVKATRAELQERREEEQKRRLEHELEVKRKKEALLQAKTEEQKRKREEKQLKAQKVREAKEKEKEEKIRRIIQEKEEKLAKEEQSKREWMAQQAKKAAEEEKVKQLIKQEKMEQKRKLNKKPPPLPTDDLQDTDDEDENPKYKYVPPLWAQKQNLYSTLYSQRFIPPGVTKEFFQMGPQTPNLTEIFDSVNADVLRRNSSAVWQTPPRYSTLPKF